MLLRSEVWTLNGAGNLTAVESMPDFDPKLGVLVSGNDIIVTLLGTRYSVTYFKRRGSPLMGHPWRYFVQQPGPIFFDNRQHLIAQFIDIGLLEETANLVIWAFESLSK
jgi:hypothetical protein